MNKIQEAKQELQLLVRAAYDQAVADGALPAGMNDEVRVEIPKDPTHGDYATGFAMQAARPLRMAPRAIGQAIADYILLLSPERIVLGGGVTHQDCLLDLVRQEAVKQLAGYIRAEALSHPETYIVGVSLNDNQGVMGAVKLAMDAEKETEK